MARILLIEDDDLIREMYAESLTSAGFVVDSFPRGDKGFEALLKNRYDLLLLDIMLPDTNGVEILKKIRQTTQIKDQKVLILGNLGQESIIQEAVNLDALGFLLKLNYNPDQVIDEVKKYVQPDNPPAAAPTN